MIVTGRLGWSHEFADDTANVSANFRSLKGSRFALSSAPIGRDAVLVGLGADIKVASGLWQCSSTMPVPTWLSSNRAEFA